MNVKDLRLSSTGIYLGDFSARFLKTWQILEGGKEVDKSERSEKFEPLLDEVHKSFEASVVALETHAHHDDTDHVAD